MARPYEPWGVLETEPTRGVFHRVTGGLEMAWGDRVSLHLADGYEYRIVQTEPGAWTLLVRSGGTRDTPGDGDDT